MIGNVFSNSCQSEFSHESFRIVGCPNKTSIRRISEYVPSTAIGFDDFKRDQSKFLANFGCRLSNFIFEIRIERLVSWLVFGPSASGKSSSGGETARAAGVIMLLVAFGFRLSDYTNLADRYNPGADLCPQAFNESSISLLSIALLFILIG